VDRRSEIQIFDCKDARIAAGPVARAAAPARAHGFHATFASHQDHGPLELTP
jgi:carotenoid cleavage dioxygenase